MLNRIKKLYLGAEHLSARFTIRPNCGACRLMLFLSLLPLASAEVVTLTQSGRAIANQSGVYQNITDVFRRVSHDWISRSPNPYGDGYSYGDIALRFQPGQSIPPGSTLNSAVLSWSFSDLAAVTDQKRTYENCKDPNPNADLSVLLAGRRLQSTGLNPRRLFGLAVSRLAGLITGSHKPFTGTPRDP
jgi:hypothetical protein